MKIKIAVDQCVGNKRIKILESLGYEVVVCANQGEPDWEWMRRAYLKKAFFAIGNDTDISRIIERKQYPMFWIDYPMDDDSLKHELIEYIHSQIQFKLKLCKTFVNLTVKKTKTKDRLV